jgi:hypothetical protein
MVKKVSVAVLVLFAAVFLSYVFVRLYYPKHPYFDGQFSYIAGTDWEFATIRPYYLWSGKRGGTVYAKVLYLGSKGEPMVSANLRDGSN